MQPQSTITVISTNKHKCSLFIFKTIFANKEYHCLFCGSTYEKEKICNISYLKTLTPWQSPMNSFSHFDSSLTNILSLWGTEAAVTVCKSRVKGPQYVREQFRVGMRLPFNSHNCNFVSQQCHGWQCRFSSKKFRTLWIHKLPNRCKCPTLLTLFVFGCDMR